MENKEDSPKEPEVNSFEELPQTGTIFDFAKNDQIFAYVNGTHLRVFDLKTFKELASLDYRFDTCTSVYIYKDWIICACSKTVYFYNRFNFETILEIPIPEDGNYKYLWNIQAIDDKIYFPSNKGDLTIYDVKLNAFSSFQLKNKEFLSMTVYNNLIYTACGQRLLIKDPNNIQYIKKEYQLNFLAHGIAINDKNIYIGSNQGEIHVYDHNFDKLKTVNFHEGGYCIWLHLVNKYLICGSTWGKYKNVLIYDTQKDEKFMIPNPKNHRFMCVRSYENDDQIFLGSSGGITVYDFPLSIQKPKFNGYIVNYFNIAFRFQ